MKLIYSTVCKYNIEVLVLNLSISISCHLIVLLHYIYQHQEHTKLFRVSIFIILSNRNGKIFSVGVPSLHVGIFQCILLSILLYTYCLAPADPSMNFHLHSTWWQQRSTKMTALFAAEPIFSPYQSFKLPIKYKQSCWTDTRQGYGSSSPSLSSLFDGKSWLHVYTFYYTIITCVLQG